jgi:TP901 family phage tail tape measure protein
MATGPGPGSHAIGGAHVGLAVDLRSYYRDLQKALQALQAWTTKANQTLGAVSFSPASLDVDDLRRSLQGLNRTLMSAGVNAKYLADQFKAMKASAAAVQAAASGTAAGSAAGQGASQAALIRANAYAQAQAALAAQRTAAAGAQAALAAKRGGAAPAAPGGIPLTPGDIFAGQAQDWFRRVTAAVRVANRKFLDWGTSVTGGFQHFARMVDAFGGSRFFSGIFQGLAQATSFVTDHGTRMGTRIAATTRGLGNFFGVQDRFFDAVASGFRGMGTAFSTVGSTFTSAVRTVGSVGMGIVRGALSAFGTVLRAGWNVLAGTIRGIASTIVGGLRTAIGSIGKLGVLAGGVGAAFSLVYITDQIVKMEHNLVRLQRTAGGTRAEIAQMANSFFDMGRTLAGVELDKVIELSIMGSRLGVPRQQLDLFTRDLAKVSAVLEDIPIEEASQRFSGLIDVFQLAYPDTIKLASALNALDIASNASARDILDIAGRMSGAASTIGLTAQQTLALATAMRQARVPIETAGTAMSQILGRMTGAELPAFARVAGMSVGRFRDLMQRDALQALVAVEQGLGRMDAFGRFRALDQLHLDGQRVRLVMLQLVPVLGRLNQYLNIANDEWTSTNSIMQGFALQSETARAQFQRMWNNIQLLAVSLGTLLLPVIKGLANGFGNLANDIRTFIEGNGKKLEEWGKRLEEMFENLGAVSRVDWGQVFKMVGGAADQFWNVFVENAKVAATNTGIVLINVLNDVGLYFIRDLIPRIVNALSDAGRSFYETLISFTPDFLWPGGAKGKQTSIANLRGLPQPMQPQGMQGLFDPKNLFGGLQPMPGLAGAPDVGKIFGFLNNQFVAGGAQQRKERVKREAAGVLGDILVRLLGGARGGGGVDRALGRQIGLANMEDQAAGLGGIGGGGGLGGVPAAPGAFGGLAGAMGPGGPGRGGAGVGGMVAGLPAIQPPPGGAGAWADRFRLMGMVPGAAGMAGGVGAMVADDSPRGRHMQLLAWRERVRARGGHAVNPWAAFQRNLVAMRNARFMALGGGRIVAGRNRRMDALRRLEAMRRGRMEGRMGVPELVREQFGAFQRNAGLLAGGWGPNLQFNPFANAQPNVMDMVGRIRNDQPRMRPNLVGQNAPPWVAGIADGITETLDRGFGKIARAIGIPQFGD